MKETKLTTCPLCGSLENHKLNTFGDYADVLFSKLCIESVKKFSDTDEQKLSSDELELLRKICETVTEYAYSYDRRAYGCLATPENESSQDD